MRTLAALAIAFLALPTAAEPFARDRIDLDVPNALERVKSSHPEHFAKIQQILTEVPQRPPAGDSVAKWMHTEFQARDVQYADLVMASLPPKKRLQFSLDNTTYVKVVTLTGWEARPVPLR